MMDNKKEHDDNYILHIQHDQILEFQHEILCWYANNGRCFPWRKNSITHYKLVISELLLQRTRAETVAAFFNTFFCHYPSWEKLANADVGEIGLVIQPIGLWKRRAISLKQLAMVMKKRNGRFPKSRIELETLPGVGQYIANAIMLLCHDEMQPLIDVNMARVLERVFGPRKLADIRHDPYLQRLALKVVQCNEAKKINWAILDFAALICLSKKPSCNICPLFKMCIWVNSDLGSFKCS